MGRIGLFRRDKKGATFEGIALSVSIIAVVCVAAADLLSFITKRSETSHLAMTLEDLARMPKPQGPPASHVGDNIDYTVTGAIPALRQRSVLDPCTGAQK